MFNVYVWQRWFIETSSVLNRHSNTWSGYDQYKVFAVWDELHCIKHMFYEVETVYRID